MFFEMKFTRSTPRQFNHIPSLGPKSDVLEKLFSESKNTICFALKTTHRTANNRSKKEYGEKRSEKILPIVRDEKHRVGKIPKLFVFSIVWSLGAG